MSQTAAPASAREPFYQEVDRAVARDDADRAARRAARRAHGDRIASLPRLLRWIGGGVLVVAAFTFMLQSWEQGDDVARYFHFLGFTVALAGAGFVCGLRIRDEKSARTFLGVAAGTVPIHFTVLGALLYSQFAWRSGFADYPAYARFSAPDAAAALLATALGLAVLAPVCWTAFLAFARPEVRRLTPAFLLANAALLVPTRNPDLIGLLGLVLPAAGLAFEIGVLRGVQALRTPEGRFVRALLWAPLAILIGRTFNLYDASSLFYASVAATLAMGLFALVPRAVTSHGVARASQNASLLPAAAAVLFLAEVLVSSLHLGAVSWLPVASLSTAALFGALSLHALDGGAGMRRLASVIATGGMALQLVIFPGVGSSVACLAVAIAASAYGFAAEQRGVFAIGLCALAFGLVYHTRYALDLYALTPWGSLALLGMGTVLGAALLERHHRALAVHVLRLKGRVETWSA